MKRICVILVMVSAVTFAPHLWAQQDTTEASGSPLTLVTTTPEEGFQLAITLARKGVTETQPDKDTLMKLRPAYSHDPDSLIMASQVIAIHFQTIAAANDYWRNME
jgi:hypothetical protein